MEKNEKILRGNYNEDYFLNSSEKKETIKKLRNINFDSLKINKHYNNKFGLPRHGVSIEEAKNNFGNFHNIINIFTRRGVGGLRYSVVYKISNKKGLYLIFLLDEKPAQLFDAYFYGGDIEKRLRRKYFGY